MTKATSPARSTRCAARRCEPSHYRIELLKKSAVAHGPAKLLHCNGHRRAASSFDKLRSGSFLVGGCHEKRNLMLSLSKHEDRACNYPEDSEITAA
jgi:hypothetical protein